MATVAFSTVACADRTLGGVAALAAQQRWPGVELRTFGDDSRTSACDPALSGHQKVRALLRRAGVEPVSLATGIGFGEAVSPPVIGHVFSDTERAVRAAQRAVDLAALLECPLVRVFGFELPAYERRVSGVRRIVDRLRKVVDHADRSGVALALENGGALDTPERLMEVVGAVASPLLGVSYNLAASWSAGQDPARALGTIGPALRILRVKDLRSGVPVRLGAGDVPWAGAIERALLAGFAGPVVFEYDRAWLPGLEEPEGVLADAIERLFGVIGAVRGGLGALPPGAAPAGAGVGAAVGGAGVGGAGVVGGAGRP